MSELTLVPSVFSNDQLTQLLKRTPSKYIYKRPAKGGGQWDYVTGTYVEKVLNYVFAWDWDFEVKDKGREGNLLWVQGRLTVRANGVAIVKEQFGRADIKRSKTGGDLDYGNDLKAASTDALKKCASLLGIASDVYGKAEFKEIAVQPAEPVTSQYSESHDQYGEIASKELKASMDALGIKYGPGITAQAARDFIKQNLEAKKRK